MSVYNSYKEKYEVKNENKETLNFIKDTISYVKYVLEDEKENLYGNIDYLKLIIDDKECTSINEINIDSKTKKFYLEFKYANETVFGQRKLYGINRFIHTHKSKELQKNLVYYCQEYYDEDDEIKFYQYEYKDGVLIDDYLDNNAVLSDVKDVKEWYSNNHRIDISFNKDTYSSLEEKLKEYSKFFGVDYEIHEEDKEFVEKVRNEYNSISKKERAQLSKKEETIIEMYNELEKTGYEAIIYGSVHFKGNDLEKGINLFKNLYKYCLKNDIVIDSFEMPLMAEDNEVFAKIEFYDDNNEGLNEKVTVIK